MAARPNWKGYLKLSLVSCPVAMFTATTSKEKVAFHLLNRATQHRLRRQMIDGDSGEVVEGEDQVHGYEVAKGEYLVIEDEEIDRVAIESTHTLDVDQFVLRADVDDVYLGTPYYLVPDGKMGEDAFAVIREAMRRRKMAGIARVVLARREHVVLLEPHGRGIVATTLRYPYEIKPADDVFDEIADVSVADEMLDLAEHIIDTKKRPFEPSSFKDHYEEALLNLIEAKKAGKPVKVDAPEKPSNVVDLMEALRRSVGTAPTASGKAAAAKAKTPAPAKPKAATAKAKPARKKAS